MSMNALVTMEGVLIYATTMWAPTAVLAVQATLLAVIEEDALVYILLEYAKL